MKRREIRLSNWLPHNFNATANDGRDPNMSIIRVNSGSEPYMFTCHFVGWDAEAAERNKFVDPYQAKLALHAKEKAT